MRYNDCCPAFGSRRITVNLTNGKRRPWTFMVYMAGDNGRVFDTQVGRIKLMAEMTTAGYRDLEEMAAVGTTENVAVVCLFDTLDGAYLIEVRPGRGFLDSKVERLAEINTGDPAVLRDFIVKMHQDYPAERTALTIWNHGTGWLEVDHYAVVRSPSDPGRSYAPIFRTTPRRIVGGETSRPIAYDDSSMDFLDTRDLHAALSEAQAKTGRRLDIIGMDACLMAMIEGARELAPYADYFVASQEVEPMAGWPYDSILRAIDDDPELRPADLSEIIVQRFAESYGGVSRSEQTVTQSAISLARSSTTAALSRLLVEQVLEAGNPTLKAAIRKAAANTLVFQDRNYRDLGDFARNIVSEVESLSYDRVRQAASRLAQHLQERGDEAVVRQTGFAARYQRACGLSVYLPDRLELNPPERTYLGYQKMVFPQTTGWDELLRWLYGD
jgi:hypothetical protein